MKLKRYVSALGVAGLSVGAMASSLAPAHADTNQLVNKIIGVGSDTTYELMADVDDVYNRSEGCNVAVTSGTQPTNNQCIRANGTAWQLSDFTPNMLLGDADHDIAYSLYPVGSSNGIKTLDADNRTGSQALPGVAKNNYSRSSRARRPPPGPPTPDPTTLRFTAIGRETPSLGGVRGPGTAHQPDGGPGHEHLPRAATSMAAATPSTPARGSTTGTRWAAPTGRS